MRLVELLARELKVWPDRVDSIWQDYDKELRFHGDLPTSLTGIFLSAKSGDCIRAHGGKTPTNRVTRADWEAERARIAKPAEAKWIRHRGGKCPVEAGVLVEIRMRYGGEGRDLAGGLRWDHACKAGGDIMAYRICEPVLLAEPEPLSVDELQAVIGPVATDGPLQWRDRINAIDSDISAQNEAHRLAIEALEEERLSLVQQLAVEGFVLVQVVSHVAPVIEPTEWKAGDLLEIVREEEGHKFVIGSFVRIEEIDHEDDDLPYKCRSVDGGISWYVTASEAKFHSRPSA